MSNKVNRKAPTEAQKKKKDPLVKDRVKWETDQEEAQYEKQQKNKRPAGDAYRIRILLSGRTSQSG